MDEYLAALVAHDPSRLPLAQDAPFTENGQQLELGDGLWHTMSARGTYSFYVDDLRTGQVGFFGTIRENETPAILALRLKAHGGSISEIETLVARGDASRSHGEHGATELEKLNGPNPVFLEDVIPSQRASRDDLIRTANKYFSGLERNDGKGEYRFTSDCNRLENDEQTTNHPRGDNPQRFDVKALGLQGAVRERLLSFCHAHSGSPLCDGG